jgi:hypothetical protein
MPKEFKPGWEYLYSGGLKQEAAVNIKTGVVYCEDGTVYSPDEIRTLGAAKQEITPEAHLVKRVFGGVITQFIRKENQNDRD